MHQHEDQIIVSRLFSNGIYQWICDDEVVIVEPGVRTVMISLALSRRDNEVDENLIHLLHNNLSDDRRPKQ